MTTRIITDSNGRKHITTEPLLHPEQEPVAFASHGVVNWIADKQFQHEAHLYSAPQRTWVGLTKEEKEKIKVSWIDITLHYANISELMDTIEQSLKEKNT